MEKLTDKQKNILQVIKQLIAKNGYPPTVREIGKDLGVSSSQHEYPEERESLRDKISWVLLLPHRWYH